MANEYLKRTPTSSGNRKTWTWCAWVKKNELSTGFGRLFEVGADTSNRSYFTFRDGDELEFVHRDSASNTDQIISDLEFRDPGSFAHFMIAANSTASIDTDRIRIYLNGILLTGYSTSNFPTINQEFDVNSLVGHYLGNSVNLAADFMGSMSDVFFVDGQALTPDVFGFHKKNTGYMSVGSTQATNFKKGQWNPKDPKIIKSNINARGGFGVNGFYLPMNSSNNPGADFHTTPNSILKLKEDLPQPKAEIDGVGDYTGALRDDPFKQYLVLAVPGVIGGKQDGYGDYSADIKGSGTNKTLTAAGDAGVASVSSYYGSAMTFDGSGDFLSIPDTEDLEFGTGDYTVEFWVNCQRATSGTVYYEEIVNKEYPFQIYRTNTGEIFLATDSNTSVYDFNDSFGTPGVGDWAHVCVERSSGTTTMFLNGVAGNVTTASVTINNTSSGFSIGAYTAGAAYPFNGYVQDLRVYKGVAKYKGGFDVPKPYTPVGIESWRTTTDTCKNNFATLNSIDNNSGVLSNGNLTYSDAGSNGWNNSRATIGASRGKWYWEMRVDAIAGVICASIAGPSGNDATNGASLGYLPGQNDDAGVTYYDNGHLYHADSQPNGQSGWGNGYGVGDTIGIALDMDDSGGKVWFSKNGSWQASGNPSTGSNAARSNLKTYSDTYFPISGTYYANTTQTFNFGQNPTFCGKVGNIIRINSSNTSWDQTPNTGSHNDWTISNDGRDLNVAVSSGYYARSYLYLDPNEKYLLSFDYVTGPSNLGVQTDTFGYLTAVDGSISPSGLSSGNSYTFEISNSNNLTITGFTGSTYDINNIYVTRVVPGYSDSNGKGEFRYEPPSGFIALCEDNLPTPAIADPGKYFKSVLWTGVNDTNKIKCGFQPDLVWIKNRNYITWHSIYDSIRGPYLELNSNTTSADRNRSVDDGLRSFDSDGFTSGLDDNSGGRPGDAYVAWCWKAGGTAVTNTDGSITSQVSVNQTAGFSIVSTNGSGTAGHGLNSTPQFIIQKRTDSASDWNIQHHQMMTSSTGKILFSTAPVAASSTPYMHNATATTFEPIYTDPCISYCWAEIEGYSKFGSYVGNNSADGPFVYCGFKPAFVLLKASSTTGNWCMIDNARNPTNPTYYFSVANAANAGDDTGGLIDFVSNGFKLRLQSPNFNGNGVTYIFAAFAESPFQTANAK